MNHTALSVSLGLPVAFVLGSMAGSGSEPTRPQTPAPQTVVAVVDFDRVYQSYPKKKLLFEKLSNEKAGIEMALNQQREEDKKLEQVAERFDPLTPKWNEAKAAAAAAQAALKSRAQNEEQRLRRERVKIMDLCYGDILRAVGALAKDKGVDLVLRLRPDAKEAPLQDRMLRSDLRDVVFAAPKLDLTDAVIKYLSVPGAPGGQPSKPSNGK